MGRVTVRESVTLAGRAERARAARSFVSQVLGPGHPCEADAVLLVGEAFGNSVRHSGSSAPGETVTVDDETPPELLVAAYWAHDAALMAEIADAAGRAGEAAIRATCFRC